MIWGAIGLIVIYCFGHLIGYFKGFKAGFKEAVTQCQEIEQSTAAPNNRMNGSASTSQNPLRETSTRS